MKIIINKIEIEIFEGAKAKDAVRMYYAQQGKTLTLENIIVRDAYGHKVGLDGSLLPDTELFVEMLT